MKFEPTPFQKPPITDWVKTPVWLMLGGRATGKTAGATEWLTHQVRNLDRAAVFVPDGSAPYWKPWRFEIYVFGERDSVSLAVIDWDVILCDDLLDFTQPDVALEAIWKGSASRSGGLARICITSRFPLERSGREMDLIAALLADRRVSPTFASALIPKLTPEFMTIPPVTPEMLAALGAVEIPSIPTSVRSLWTMDFTMPCGGRETLAKLKAHMQDRTPLAPDLFDYLCTVVPMFPKEARGADLRVVEMQETFSMPPAVRVIIKEAEAAS
jgi:hypothetical protein